MSNISKTLTQEWKDFSKVTNAAQSKLKLESDAGSSLALDENNETLNGFVEYSSHGGGNIKVKIDRVGTKTTKDAIKVVEASGMEISGSPENVERMFKELLR